MPTPATHHRAESPHAPWAIITSVLVLGAAAVVLLHLELELLTLVRARTAFVLAVTALLVALVLRRDLFRGRRARRTTLLIAGASIAGCAVASWQPDARSFSAYDAVIPAGMMAVGWVAYLLLLRPRGARERDGELAHGGEFELGGRTAAGAALAAFFVALAAQWARYHGLGGLLVIDEVLYFFQGRLLEESGYGWTMPAEDVRFFGIRHTWHDGEQLRSQYPPGWPAIIWLARRAGVEGVLPAVLLAVATIGTYLVGRLAHDRTTGALAALLCATLPPLVVYEGSEYRSHAPTMAAMALCGWLLLGGSASRGAGRWARLLLAGACVGLAFAIRPLTALAVGASLGLWIAIREGWRWRRLAATAGLVAVGAAPLVAATARYNDITTGSPTTFGYAASNGDVNDFGFGQRGVVEFDTQGQQALDARRFTVGDAAAELVRRARDVALLLPAALLVPLVVLARQHGARIEPRIVLAFGVLPAAYFFYWYPGTRYILEIVPFLMVGVAALLTTVIRHDRRSGLLLATLLLVGNVARVGTAALQSGPPAAAERALFAQVHATIGRDSSLLLFVPDGRTDPGGVHAFTLLYRFNADPDARVVVARDLGPENVLLARRHPGRRPFRLVAEVPSPGAPTIMRAGQIAWVLRPLDVAAPQPEEIAQRAR